ncbi:hypothetical protein SNEBB_004109 [Seison nebaliae]|nr:hypothetical protein SNEBB_004109 [Seison nebaliae]
MYKIDIKLNVDGTDFALDSKSILRKVFWIILMCIAFAGASYFTYIYADAYFNQKLTTTVTEKTFSTELSLPVITLCSTQSLRKDKISQQLPVLSVLEHMDSFNKFTKTEYYDKLDEGSEYMLSYIKSQD